MGTLVTLCMFLVGFYVNSFASAKSVEALKSLHEKDIIKQDAKIDRVLTGLCIIDKRTCKLSK